MKTKGRYYIPHLKLNIAPFKTKSEREMQEIIHKNQVIARKRQIQLMKDDLEIPLQPLQMSQYTTPERRSDIIKVGINYLRLLLP